MGAQFLRKNLIATSLVLAVVASLWLTNTSFATTLVPDTAPVPALLTGSPTGANHLAGTGAVPFSSLPFGKFNGTLTTDVYNNDPFNPYGVNALTFTYLIINNATVNNVALHRFVASDFAGFLVDDGGYTNDFAGVIPTSMDQSGSGVGFNYPQPNTIPAGGNTRLLIIHSNATAYTTSINSLIDTEVAFAASLGPTVVPEPTTVGLLGLAGVALVGRRRR